ncbi:bifunctional non-homologous end joining protein LigD [Mumia flava]|uniref:Bifunctional non-homologous end joining protein LigD n=1 Tax=Mumia flava TaxID=1348852 RepID=A0A0B2AY73_9ACTN|nr:non-homologous end-joining DNA ligase [Mumia flava]PJJ56149.1 bifunctional non-homologous end joining protein LigD [Mumia flava]
MAGNVLEIDDRTVKVSNLDKVLYPSDGTTKYDVIQYVLAVADPLLAQLADRPCTRKRWPDGVDADSFFEKNAPRGTPEWVRVVEVATPGSSRGRDSADFPVLAHRADLVWVANLAALELHTPQWTVGPRGGIHDADRLVIDLDPGAPAGLAEAVEVAHLVRDRLTDDGWTVVPVTSGSKGVHLYAGRGATAPSDTLRDYAHGIADELAAAHPKRVLSVMRKAERRGKVFLDWSQNVAAKTTVTPYSLRGRERPWVAAPRVWEELDDPSEVTQVLAHEMPGRLETYGDPMAALRAV